MSACVICDSPGGKPRDVLVELDSSWVTAGRMACLSGYVCVVSRKHVVEPFELDDNGGWWRDCMLVARALNDELRPIKVNYEIHGNTIAHLHLHIYPRTANDPFTGRTIDGTALLFERSPQDLDRMRRAIAEQAGSGDANRPFFSKVDAVVVRVPSLDEGLAFYRDRLGHQVSWRTPESVGLLMPDADTELVLSSTTGPETDLRVQSVDDAAERWVAAGGHLESAPFDIPVGRVAVVRDPFGNTLIFLDLTKGRYQTDQSGNVTGIGGGRTVDAD
jgi:diadenosine tetraphosphate (Ap4A) HIT family hydrolase/predicted enzyme related to lactoylglutathione lyase